MSEKGDLMNKEHKCAREEAFRERERKQLREKAENQ